MKRRNFLKATGLVPGLGILTAARQSVAATQRPDMPYKPLGRTGGFRISRRPGVDARLPRSHHGSARKSRGIP